MHAHRTHRSRHVSQFVQDTALSSMLHLATARPQVGQLYFQLLHGDNSIPHVGKVGVQHRIDFVAGFFWRVPEMQEAPHFVKRHVQ